MRALIVALGVVLAVSIPVLLSVALPSRTYTDNMPGGPYHTEGLFSPPDNASGLYDPETSSDGTTYRWSTDHATLTFPYAANTGRDTIVAMRLGANFSPAQPPATATVAINNVEVPGLRVAGGYGVYTATLDTGRFPNLYLDPAHIQGDLRSSTFSIPTDPRHLGVAVDWVQLETRPSVGQVAVEALVWGAAILLVLLFATSRLGLAWGAGYALLALLSLVLVHITAMPRAIPPVVEVALVGLAWVLGALLAPARRGTLSLVVAFVLAGTGIWLALAGRRLGDWQIDDAYISYRYAWNLVHGFGLVYNPGEIVEGYTNFLWTLLGAAAIALGLSPAGVTLAANIAFGMGLVALTYVLGRVLFALDANRQRPWTYVWPLAAAIIVAVDVNVLTYGARGSGIEAIAFSFLSLLSVALLWRGENTGLQWWHAAGGLVLALPSLTRPEGMLVAVLLLALRAFQDWRAGQQWGRLLVWSLIPYLLVLAPYQAWRITFYGYPFPNTFYAKTGATLSVVGRGLEYALQFASDHWLIIALLAIGLLFAVPQVVRRARGKSEQTGGLSGELRWCLAFFAAIYSAYVIVVGGDWFPVERFFLPVLVPLVLLAVEAARTLFERLERRSGVRWAVGATAVVATGAYIIFALWLQTPGQDLAERTNNHSTYIDRWGTAGVWLRENTPPETVTAARAAGAMAYYSQRRVIDMYGLNDLHIGHLDVGDMGEKVAGHEKSDPVYVLQRKPDYVLASWEDYFDPVRSQMLKEYGEEIVRSPTGPEVKWLHLKGGLGP